MEAGPLIEIFNQLYFPRRNPSVPSSSSASSSASCKGRVVSMHTVTMLPLIFLLLLHNVCIALSSLDHAGAAATIVCEAGEMEALLDLKHAAAAYNLWSWVRGSDCCSWPGIRCHNQTGRVIQVELHGQADSEVCLQNCANCLQDCAGSETCLQNCVHSLQRSVLPASFVRLTQLRVLDVRWVCLKATMPPGLFGSLQSLVHLSMGSSGLSGAIPRDLGSLPDLQYLDLSINCLSGTIPAELGALERLSYLNLSYNLLDGTIPSQMSGMQHLLYLDLSNQQGNSLDLHDAWPILGNLSGLQHLDISSMWPEVSPSWPEVSPSWPERPPSFGMELPPSRPCRLSSLRYFACGGVQLIPASHAMPFCFETFTHRLEHLDLSFTGLNMSSPDQFGYIAQALSSASNLRYLSLAGNDIKSFPSWVLRLPLLETLDLTSVGLHHFPNSTNCTMSNLRHLDLPYNDLQAFPTCVLGFSLLETLDLPFNNLAGRFPVALANLSALRHLDLEYNNLKGPIEFEQSTNLSALQRVYLGWNALTGCMPEAFKRLMVLDLSINSFHGSLPAGFGWTMEYLDVSYNNFSGTLPIPTSGNCSTMLHAAFTHNHFSGSIPALNCSQMSVLDLSHNELIGCIPTSLGPIRRFDSSGASLLHWDRQNYNLVLNLRLYGFGFLLLNDNHLTCSIPSSLGESGQEIAYLDMSNNNFIGSIPNTLGGLGHNLLSLSLSNNELSGAIPPSLSNLTGLLFLDLSINNLSGRVPQALFQNISQQFWFNASNNELSGPLPGPLPAVASLDLHSNFFEGPLPLYNSPQANFSLEFLDLSFNNFNGTIPNQFCKMDALSFLSLSSNHFSGSIPGCFCAVDGGPTLESMVYLNLSNNSLSGRLPSSMRNCSSLQFVKLGNNFLEGGIDIMGSCNNLLSLELHDNNFIGEIPPSLKNCAALRVMDLSDNGFTGKIPSWIGDGHMLYLQFLNLRSNHLDGSIPSSLTNLSALWALDLANNHLSGFIPKGLARLQGMQHQQLPSQVITEQINASVATVTIIDPRIHMTNGPATILSKGQERQVVMDHEIYTYIDLSENHLHGEIPPEMGTLAALVSLNLSHNMLGGPIPSTFGGLRGLESLDLSNNELNGTIPKEFVQLTFLEVLNVANNHLHGRIPKGPQLNTFNDPSSFTGNAGLCGDPLPRPCPPSPKAPSPPPPAAVGTDQNVGLLERMREDVSVVGLGLSFAFAFVLVVYLLNFVNWKARQM